MIIQSNEVKNYTGKLKPSGEGDFRVSVEDQRAMLTAFLNEAHSKLEAVAEAEARGIQAYTDLPQVMLRYRKVTKAKARIAGKDYRPLPGVSFDTHLGPVTTVARNKQGRVYFTIKDRNRAGTGRPWVAVRLEGVVSFEFEDADIQAERLRRVTQAA